MGVCASCLQAADRWTELNIGPFYVYSQGDLSAARKVLTDAEQVRWVLGGLLENKDLRTLWPIRIVLTKSAGVETGASLITQNGEYVSVLSPDASLPTQAIATTLLRDNTPRLPDEVESGLPALFSSLHAEGSRVTWGGAVAHPDLDWARMQLFGTRFEYGLSFHIFVASVKNRSGMQAAERNAFGKSYDELEREAAANLANQHWQAVPVSGRPLDPRRDFGEHSVDGAIVRCFLADAQVVSKPKEAEAAFKAGIESGAEAAALGYEGLADLTRHDNGDADRFLQDAMRAGSRSAPVYLAAAEGHPEGEARLTLLRRAQQLNPLWAEPVFQEGAQTEDLKAKEDLFRRATTLDPRGTEYWLALAELQGKDGHAAMAQASWLRAEDSALTEDEKERIHALRLAGENERLDAADAERRREREAVHLADQHAQDAEAARIHAAEEKANRAVADAGGGQDTTSDAVPWEDTLPRRQAKGVLTSIDCTGKPARAIIKQKNGQTIFLLFDQPDAAGLTCGPQRPVHSVVLSYAVEADRPAGVAGRILSLQIAQ